MAKKSQQTEPAPARTGPPATLARAIREALADHGNSASKSVVEAWIKAHHPTLSYKEATLNSSLSNIRKKLREEEMTSMHGEPTVADLLRVKTTAAERGGVEQLLSFVDQAEHLAKKFGGLDRVRKCLEKLQEVQH